MDIYEDTKYYTTKEKLKETLSTYGVAIIPNVINDQECQQMTNGMWEYLEHITQKWPLPISRRNPGSWGEFYKLYPKHSMLLQHHNVGHMEAIWDLRQNPKIVDIFAHFWNTTPYELLVSFDGCSFGVPPEETNRGWNRNNTWYHCDQSPIRPGFECVQSWINAYDTNEGDATLVILENSHNFHKKFQEFFNIIDKKDWFKLNQEHYNFYINNNCLEKIIKCPKGYGVFWDSRTVHYGKPINKTSPNNLRFWYAFYYQVLSKFCWQG